jgi:hypothetical protein
MNLDKRAQIGIVGIFAVVAFTATGFVMYESARNLRADGEIDAPAVAQASPAADADTNLPATTASASPGTTTPSPSDDLTGTVTEVSPDTTALLDPIDSPATSGTFDYRYLILIVDAAVIAVLLAVFVIRLLLKILARSEAGAVPAGVATATPVAGPANPNDPVTVDQLNIDIPL